MVLCHDRNFSIAIGLGLGPGNRGRDKGFPFVNGPFGQLGFCVSRQDFLCRNRVGRLVSRPRLLVHDRARLVCVSRQAHAQRAATERLVLATKFLVRATDD